MLVKTIYPIYYNRKPLANVNMYSSLDGSSTSDEIKAFQIYANSKGLNLVTDGIWGPKTAAAWTAYGVGYQSMSNMGANPNLAQQNTSPTNPKGETKKGHFWDKVKNVWEKAKDTGIVDSATQAIKDKYGINKPGTQSGGAVDNSASPNAGMSTNKKVLIGVGVVAAIAVVYYLAKNKKK